MLRIALSESGKVKSSERLNVSILLYLRQTKQNKWEWNTEEPTVGDN
jgi:hypothetical protein